MMITMMSKLKMRKRFRCMCVNKQAFILPRGSPEHDYLKQPGHWHLRALVPALVPVLLLPRWGKIRLISF